jgi:hypothetical protein
LSPGVDGRLKKKISHLLDPPMVNPPSYPPPLATYQPSSPLNLSTHLYLPTPFPPTYAFSYQPLFLNDLPSCSSLDGNIAKASFGIVMFLFHGHDCDCHRRLLDFGITMLPLSIASIK